jgi:hypothetical protein
MNPIDCYMQNIPMGNATKPVPFDAWFESLEAFRRKYPTAVIGGEEKSPKLIEKKPSPVLSVKESTGPIKTRICKNILQDDYCRFRKCNFAHSAEELNPMQCKFRMKCRIRETSCSFIHPKESKEQFIQRLKRETRKK